MFGPHRTEPKFCYSDLGITISVTGNETEFNLVGFGKRIKNIEKNKLIN